MSAPDPDRHRVPCLVDLEATHDHFHAHVDLGAVEVGPGDSVLLTEAPTRIEFGQKRQYPSSALVHHAGPLRRAWTRLVGRFGFQDLYDVGFEG